MMSPDLRDHVSGLRGPETWDMVELEADERVVGQLEHGQAGSARRDGGPRLPGWPLAMVGLTTVCGRSTIRPSFGGAMFSRPRFVAEVSVAVLGAAIFIATLIQPHWFELLFDDAPDGGDGSLESAVAIVASLVAMGVFAGLAVREWRLRPFAGPGRNQ